MSKWSAPKIWPESQVIILGGGDTLLNSLCVPIDIQKAIQEGDAPLSEVAPYMEKYRNARIIAVNEAFKIAPWLDVSFFGDKGWWLKNRIELGAWAGFKVTCHESWGNKSKAHCEGIKYLQQDPNYRLGISDNPKKVAWNFNSGFAAISLAAHFGARQIILVGFDMRHNNGRSHFHAAYAGMSQMSDYKRHMTGAAKIQKDALSRGIEIINASPKSAIVSFKHKPLEEIKICKRQKK